MQKTEVNTETKTEVEVVVRLEVEKVVSFSSLFIRWQRTFLDRVVRQPVQPSVFDLPESVVEVHAEEETNS